MPILIYYKWQVFIHVIFLLNKNFHSSFTPFLLKNIEWEIIFFLQQEWSKTGFTLLCEIPTSVSDKNFCGKKGVRLVYHYDKTIKNKNN